MSFVSSYMVSITLIKYNLYIVIWLQAFLTNTHFQKDLLDGQSGLGSNGIIGKGMNPIILPPAMGK